MLKRMKFKTDEWKKFNTAVYPTIYKVAKRKTN